MKKVVFLASAVLAFAACSETLEVNQGSPITFRSHVGTKAIELTTATLNSFKVTALTSDGTAHFTAVEYTKDASGSSATYTSEVPQMWPKTGSLDFYAYANEGTATVTINNETKALTNYVSGDGTAQLDFVTAHATGSYQEDGVNGVTLTFKHRLSQIAVKAKSNSSHFTYKVNGVQFANIKSTGSFSFADNTWTPGSDKKDFVYTMGTPLTLNADAAYLTTEADPFMLIPQQLVKWDLQVDKNNTAKGAFLAVGVNVATKAGVQLFPAEASGYGYACLPIDTNWQPGKKYTYVLDFTNGPGVDEGGDPILNVINFDVIVEDWVDDEEVDLNVDMQ